MNKWFEKKLSIMLSMEEFKYKKSRKRALLLTLTYTGTLLSVGLNSMSLIAHFYLIYSTDLGINLQTVLIMIGEVVDTLFAVFLAMVLPAFLKVYLCVKDKTEEDKRKLMVTPDENY